MKPQPHTSGVLPWALLAVPVLYLAALLASGYEDGMTVFDLMGRFSTLLERPFAIQWTPHTPQFLLGALVLYAFCVLLFQSARQNRRPGEEHGSAHWGDAKQLCRKYQDKNPENNVILTQHIRMSLNSRKHQRNLLQIVTRDLVSGKTRYVVKPNIYLANASYICTDPKGELARNTIPLLLRKGYVVKVFDLVDLERSDCYNPFRYIRSDADVLKLISNFIRNTTPKNAHSNDPFWEKSETALDCALMLYLLHEAPPEEQTMEMMLTMLEYGAAKEGDGDYQSPLDLLFEGLAEENPNHIALRQYRVFKQAPSETAMSILITASVRLAPFTLPEVQRITATDNMELEKLGGGGNRPSSASSRTATTSPSISWWGCSIPRRFRSSTIKRTRCMAEACPSPSGSCSTSSPMSPCRWICPAPGHHALPECDGNHHPAKYLQLKELFKDSWEGIIGNADAFLYLGGNEQSTHKYVSELLGKETIETRTSSQSKGRNGSYSQNFQQAGRELLTPDEVRMLDNRYALVLVRGEAPVIDEKYDLMRHPNIKLTGDGGAAPYTHASRCLYSAGDLDFTFTCLDEVEIIDEL